MHSFRPSRSRILFEVLCALIVSASCVGAWMDLGTLAFLPAAGAAGLYGLVHLFDMRTPKMAVVAEIHDEPQVAEVRDDRIENVESLWPVHAAQPVSEPIATEAAVAESPKPKRRSRKKQPAAETASSTPAMEVRGIEEVAELPEPPAIEEDYHPPIAPLFEHKPLVSQQRVFGRKAG